MKYKIVVATDKEYKNVIELGFYPPERMIEDLGLLNCKFEELARFGSFTD